jgi:hypothetical protein
MWGSCGVILFKNWLYQTNKNQKQLLRNATHSKNYGTLQILE